MALVASTAALRFCVLGSSQPMTTARKMRSNCCLQRDRLFARGAIETMFDLTRPSSHWLVRWELCLETAECFDVKMMSKSLVLTSQPDLSETLSSRSTSSTVNKAADCSCAGSCMDQPDFYPQHVGWHCLSSHLPMWNHEAAGSYPHVDCTVEKHTSQSF